MTKGLDPASADAIAVEVASRELHSDQAEMLISEKIGAIDQYLLESSELRRKWATYIGQVSASHRWPFSEIDRRLGVRGRVPDPLGGEVDLGLLAWTIRVIDAAHINSDRASFLDRALRSHISTESLIHWKAQELIVGPRRQDNRLVFASMTPIEDVDAWWLFYELASTLDNEIISAAEYLDTRAASKGRFSLEGVKAVRSPKSFATLVVPNGFEPVDVRVHPQSIKRLVELLGGKSLYGRDYFAPIRELLQNARDAILLQQAADEGANQLANKGEIHVALRVAGDETHLSVADNGTGMTANVVTNYLLGIAADYWHSSDFFADYPGVASRGFEPAGRFGIGFLSVFMLGDEVNLQTERRGGPRLTLRLSGLERRGALVTGTASGRPGTTIQIRLPHEKLSDFESLDAIVKAKAPLLEFPIVVSQEDRVSTILPGWWKTVPQEEFFDFIANHDQVAYRPAHELRELSARDLNPNVALGRRDRHFQDIATLERWPGQQPEIVTETLRVLAIPAASEVLLCSKGLAINKVRVPGITGLIEIGSLELNAARSQTLRWDKTSSSENILRELRPKMIEALDGLITEGQIPTRYEFLSKVGRIYGSGLLTATKLPWITVIDPPGHARLVTASEFIERVASVTEVLVGFGVGPWSVGSVLYDRYPQASKSALLIPVSNSGQPRFGSYRDHDTVVWAALPQHFRSADIATDHNQAILLMVTLDLIAQSWNVDIQKFLVSPWVRVATSNICGHFAKEAL